jgi:hypothetical protein
MNSFQEQLVIGKLGESLIANWFKKRGFHVLPVYEKEINEGKGPQLFTASGEDLIAPDLLVFNGASKVIWIEAKHKSAFTWYRRKSRWTTGIDMIHYSNYLKISEISNWPMWLMFLQRDGVSKDMPSGMVSPSGLYGGDIKMLKDNESHRSPKYGKGGMVYWAEQKLKYFASLTDVIGGNNNQLTTQETANKNYLRGEQLFLPGISRGD